jgi:DNA polymerase-3 subunit epsilon
MNITKPIAFFDIESTGVDRENDRIVEIAVSKLDPSGQVKTISRRVNPTIPIPASASEIHGIKDEDVANEPTFKQIAKSLLDLLHGCDIAGFNSNSFDVPMLFNEFQRAGHFWDYTTFNMIDVGNLFKIQEPRTLSAAVKFYLGKELEGAHGAAADIEATVDVFIAQCAKYGDQEGFPATIEEMALYTNFGNKIADLSGKFVYNKEGVLLLNFGKHKGSPAVDHIDFLEWMITKSFASDTYHLAASIIDQYYNSR